MSIEQKQNKLAELKEQVRQLEAEVPHDNEVNHSTWPPEQFYGAYYAMTGGILGIFGALVSLMVNVIAAPIAGKSPLELIKVYLTFPVGARALELSAESNGLVLAMGCCLYIATGMLIGIPIYFFLVRFCGKDGSLGKRLAVASVLSLAIWAINFYGILSWLQPLLFKGNSWITDPSVMPPWVAAGTHLVFGWTLALLYPWGQFTPYRPTSNLTDS
ncbi:hypothetical protein [Thalassoglobus polymorphus]|uniref:Uncharacterized protein n=1 Tax=Thalassoglobus polymorphus TaxID=2527994 RepID=A0A517QMP4_9PLAN|nr:hypothetical protein [Thalassoglobus polymorphus]QDT32893.1 hypothetical protein Mal48_21410 [Thalassoglobus polymorphus]